MKEQVYWDVKMKKNATNPKFIDFFSQVLPMIPSVKSGNMSVGEASRRLTGLVESFVDDIRRYDANLRAQRRKRRSRNSIESEAPTVEEAIEVALKTLNVVRDVKVSVRARGKSSIMGVLSNKPARVHVRITEMIKE